jgi:hypothetical protein
MVASFVRVQGSPGHLDQQQPVTRQSPECVDRTQALRPRLVQGADAVLCTCNPEDWAVLVTTPDGERL